MKIHNVYLELLKDTEYFFKSFNLLDYWNTDEISIGVGHNATITIDDLQDFINKINENKILDNIYSYNIEYDINAYWVDCYHVNSNLVNLDVSRQYVGFEYIAPNTFYHILDPDKLIVLEWHIIRHWEIVKFIHKCLYCLLFWITKSNVEYHYINITFDNKQNKIILYNSTLHLINYNLLIGLIKSKMNEYKALNQIDKHEIVLGLHAKIYYEIHENYLNLLDDEIPIEWIFTHYNFHRYQYYTLGKQDEVNNLIDYLKSEKFYEYDIPKCN